MSFLITLINIAVTVFNIALLVYIAMSYFVSPTNQVRSILARIFEPLLQPIRKYVRPIGGFDFSPVILLIIVLILESILRAILRPLI